MKKVKQKDSGLSATTPIADVASIISDKTTSEKTSRLKQFDEYRAQLDKLKAEFLEVYKKKIETAATFQDFELLCTLGQGSFGAVVLCKHKSSSKYYAMKIMNKAKIIKERQLEHTFNERNILVAVRFPFLINMEFSFKDNCNVYMVLPFIPGGDMFSLLRKARTLKEKEAKFYGAQVIMALEYLHYMDLIYRDLKPENIVVDINGYLKITDFGFCKMVKLRTYTLCGTPEYLAPEIILSKGYGKTVDWWSLGIFLFEMIAGYTPFYAEEPMMIYEKITIGKFKFTVEFSSEARDLIKNILQVDLSRRFGNLKNGVYDIKCHDWFKLTDWQAIYNRKAIAPFIPKVESPGDAANFDHFGQIRLQESIHEKFPKEFEDF